MQTSSRIALLLAALLFSAITPAIAAPPQPYQTIPGLGTSCFPVSTKSPEARTAFLRGLLLLHLFEYGQAAEAFIAAEKLDPTLAIAFWGEAMTFNHGVWDQLDAAAGQTALAKLAPTPEARAALATTPRERAYLAAAELLYDGTGTKPERDLRYTKSMERLAADYPADDDAQLFYALALISQSQGVRDVPVYLHAAEISKDVFARQPDNPGAAHYWIHGMDDPQHAAGALVAARALSKIAPNAPHAQHMCSHIFIALGMWDEVVQANVDAIRVGDAIDKADGFPPNDCGHYANWLAYGYFQQGRVEAAREAISACAATGSAAPAWIKAHPDKQLYNSKNPGHLQVRLAAALTGMRETAVIETGDWSNASGRIVAGTPPSSPEDMARFSFVAGYAAAQLGELEEARTQLQSLMTLLEKIKAEPNPDPEDTKTFAIMGDELSGLIHAKAHDFTAALADLDRASAAYSAMAFAFGPPVTIKPPDELLGEVLLERNDPAKGDPAAACAAFQHALSLAPRRSLSLLGLARAQKAADDPAAATTYKELLTIWHAADPTTLGLAETRASAK